ncbi:MAG TPA: TadE/TadG family type IV pilus assembly protein [Rickettsiales bacterium]|nr:TadE/TadG family type IV pilus assembly protein [Rickettsiales bacterium]
MRKTAVHGKKLRGAIHTIITSNEGSALVEFAICLPIILLLFYGGVEVARYLLIVKKLQDSATQVASIITSTDPVKTTLTKSDMDAIATGAFLRTISPYANGKNAFVIISDIYADPDATSPGTPTVKWRYCGGEMNLEPRAHKSTLLIASRFGNVGAPADLSSLSAIDAHTSSAPFTLESGDEIVVAEVFYDFHPIIENSITNGVISARRLYFSALSVPRFAHLNGLVGTTFKGNCG